MNDALLGRCLLWAVLADVAQRADCWIHTGQGLLLFLRTGLGLYVSLCKQLLLPPLEHGHAEQLVAAPGTNAWDCGHEGSCMMLVWKARCLEAAEG
jgi:hypothetical protein